MDAPITKVDRKAFKAAFVRAVAKVADLYVDHMFEDVKVKVEYGTRDGAFPAEVHHVKKMLAEMSDAGEALSAFFNNHANDLFCDESVEPFVKAMEDMLT
jgi:hypothetical protein